MIVILLSTCALALSAFTYFNHDRKIKKQQQLINDYQIEKVEKEKIESLHAVIEAKTIRKREGLNGIVIYNAGKSTAKSLVVTIPANELYEIMSNPCPIDLRPQHNIEINIMLFNNFPEKVELKFEWKDEFKDTNIERQYVQLL